MSLVTITNLLLVFAFVSYFIHSYFHNTVDFTWYRHLMSVPAKNTPLKYLYVNSFIMFMISALVFVASVAIDALQVQSLAAKRTVLALAAVLALGALRLITKPHITKWPQRAG